MLLGLFGGLSLALGILLLAINPQINQMQFAILGAVAVLLGVFNISDDEKSWPVAMVSIAIGFYFLARAGNFIENDWLRITAGILSLAVGLAIALHSIFYDSKK